MSPSTVIIWIVFWGFMAIIAVRVAKLKVFCEETKLKIEILNDLAKLILFIAACVAFFWYGYDQILLQIAENSSDPVKVISDIKVESEDCKQNVCQYKFSVIGEVENLSKRPFEITYSNLFIYHLPAATLKQSRERNVFLPVDGPTLESDFKKADEFGWVQIYKQDNLIITRKPVEITEYPHWKNAARGGGLTGTLAPKEKTRIEQDYYLVAEKGSWVGARIYININYGLPNRTFRIHRKWIELTDTEQK